MAQGAEIRLVCLEICFLWHGLSLQLRYAYSADSGYLLQGYHCHQRLSSGNSRKANVIKAHRLQSGINGCHCAVFACGMRGVDR